MTLKKTAYLCIGLSLLATFLFVAAIILYMGNQLAGFETASILQYLTRLTYAGFLVTLGIKALHRKMSILGVYSFIIASLMICSHKMNLSDPSFLNLFCVTFFIWIFFSSPALYVISQPDAKVDL